MTPRELSLSLQGGVALAQPQKRRAAEGSGMLLPGGGSLCRDIHFYIEFGRMYIYIYIKAPIDFNHGRYNCVKPRQFHLLRAECWLLLLTRQAAAFGLAPYLSNPQSNESEVQKTFLHLPKQD